MDPGALDTDAMGFPRGDELLSPEARSLVELREQVALDPDWLVELFAPLGLPRAEVTRACRRQRGLLLRRIEHRLAEEAARRLSRAGVHATAVPENDYPAFERRVEVSLVHGDDLGVHFPALLAQGKPGSVPWEDLRLVCGCLLEEDGQSSLGEAEELAVAPETAPEDRREIARKAVTAHRERLFDWSQYLETDPMETVNKERRTQVHERGLSQTRKRLRRFDRQPAPARYVIGNPGLRGRLMLWDGQVAYVVRGENTGLLLDGARLGGHWLRDFSQFVRAAADRASGAKVPPSTRKLANRGVPVDYIPDDELAWMDECRWWLAGMDGRMA